MLLSHHYVPHILYAADILPCCTHKYVPRKTGDEGRPHTNLVIGGKPESLLLPVNNRLGCCLHLAYKPFAGCYTSAVRVAAVPPTSKGMPRSS